VSIQSRSTTPSSLCRSPALDYVVTGSGAVGVGPAQLAAVFSDVRQAFAGVGPSPSGLAVGSGSCPRPSSTGGLPGVPASPRVGMSRDLLEATDYITGAVTSLVRELHSGENENENDNDIGVQCLERKLPVLKGNGNRSPVNSGSGNQALDF